ncbi:MAG: hypothetical protein KME55_08660 [Nostoc indistinguendum CM1-VF10]|nr:hypothetical protein [Nostoc indistinguendum CM1-VF10]
MRSQYEIARLIHFKGADYILALKANHPTLFEDVKQWFENAAVNNFDGIEFSYDVRVESAHHRKEKRQIWAVSIEQMGGLYTAFTAAMRYSSSN